MSVPARGDVGRDAGDESDLWSRPRVGGGGDQVSVVVAQPGPARHAGAARPRVRVRHRRLEQGRDFLRSSGRPARSRSVRLRPAAAHRCSIQPNAATNSRSSTTSVTSAIRSTSPIGPERRADFGQCMGQQRHGVAGVTVDHQTIAARQIRARDRDGAPVCPGAYARSHALGDPQHERIVRHRRNIRKFPHAQYPVICPLCAGGRVTSGHRSGESRRHGWLLPEIIAGMRFILNVLWLIFGGLFIALGYALAGVICCILIITIPFGIASFRMANYALWPFGRTMVRDPDAGRRIDHRQRHLVHLRGLVAGLGPHRDGDRPVRDDHRHSARDRQHQDGAGLAHAAGPPHRRCRRRRHACVSPDGTIPSGRPRMTALRRGPVAAVRAGVPVRSTWVSRRG